MTNRILASTVVKILRMPGLSKIGFELGGLVVTGMRYSMVANAIEQGKIECRVVDKFKSAPDQHAKGMVTAAQYVNEGHAMLFSREGFGATHSEERTIVHEATHAIFDLFADSKDTRTLAIDDESAAVLAEALYMRLTDRTGGNFSMFIDGPQDEALKLADKMLAETGDFERDKRTYRLQPLQTQKFRAAVAKDWNFTKYIGSDGFPTDSSGVKYIYDGVVKCYSCWVHGK